MAYPPSEPAYQDLYWNGGQVPPFRELIPPDDPPKSKFIHFDIDPNNGKCTRTFNGGLENLHQAEKTDPLVNSPLGRD